MTPENRGAAERLEEEARYRISGRTRIMRQLRGNPEVVTE